MKPNNKSWSSKIFENFQEIPKYISKHNQGLVFSSVLILMISTGLIIYFTRKYEDYSGIITEENEGKLYSDTTCVCVFDLDGTLTCGLDRGKAAVEECKKRRCKLAINTARPMPYYSDIKMSKLGLTNNDVKDDVYYGDWIEGLVSTLSHFELGKKIADTKSKHLKTIQEKYKIGDPKRIILFDDVKKNVDVAEKNGFSIIHANHPKCGLNENIVSDISRILDN